MRKNSIKAAVGRKLITCRQFDLTLLLTESICNSRQLTAVREDGIVFIPPTDLLGISKPLGLPSLSDNPNSDPSYIPSYVYNREDLIGEWRGALDCSERVWDRIYREYLPSLRDRQVFLHKQGRSVTRR